MCRRAARRGHSRAVPARATLRHSSKTLQDRQSVWGLARHPAENERWGQGSPFRLGTRTHSDPQRSPAPSRQNPLRRVASANPADRNLGAIGARKVSRESAPTRGHQPRLRAMSRHKEEPGSQFSPHIRRERHSRGCTRHARYNRKDMLILASASPRRAELLRNAGISFTVDPAHVPEAPLADESPLDYARRLAREKARAVFARHPQDTVLGADTIVVVSQLLLEKPTDADDAARMLCLLSGRHHQ